MGSEVNRGRVRPEKPLRRAYHGNIKIAERKFAEKIWTWGNKNMKRKLALADIAASHKDMDYTQLYSYILGQIEAGELAPVKASGLNGRKPALYNAYWHFEKEKEYVEIREELAYRLSPLLHTEYYMKNPERYQKDREKIQFLSTYLTERRESLKVPVTVNERSFEIFFREKFLEREGGMELLSRLGISAEYLNFYITSEPMSYYSHSKQAPQKLLIIENKDTFYSMRRHLTGGAHAIMGLDIGTLIYGGGKGIYRSLADYIDAVEPYFAHEENRLYYFGDLDYEGILIYETLVKKYSEKIKINLFTDAYERMIARAEEFGTDRLPYAKEGQNTRAGSYFLTCFCGETAQKIRRILSGGRYIPQEILNERDY